MKYFINRIKREKERIKNQKLTSSARIRTGRRRGRTCRIHRHRAAAAALALTVAAVIVVVAPSRTSATTVDAVVPQDSVGQVDAADATHHAVAEGVALLGQALLLGLLPLVHAHVEFLYFSVCGGRQ